MLKNIKVFIDTNVILDVLLEREPFFSSSKEIWSLVERRKITGFISINSLTDIFYIARKHINSDGAHELVNKLLYVFDFVPLSKSTVKQALSLEIKDLEDALQVISARKALTDFLITRDIKGFMSVTDIKIITPEEFLKSQTV